MPLYVGLPILTIYHLVQQLRPLNHCGFSIRHSFSVLSFLSEIESSDEDSLAGILHTSIGNGVAEGLVLALPFFWGVVQGAIRATANVGKSEETFLESVRKIVDEPRGVWNEWMSVLVMHPYPRLLNRLTKLLLWDGRLSEQAREEAFLAIIDVTNRNGYAKVLGMQVLSQLCYTAHLRDISSLLELEGMSAEEARQWVSIKSRSLQRLHFLSTLGAENGFFFVVYSRYLLWALGLPPSRLESVAWTLWKCGKLFLQVMCLFVEFLLWKCFQARLLQALIYNVLGALKCPNPGGYKVKKTEFVFRLWNTAF